MVLAFIEDAAIKAATVSPSATAVSKAVTETSNHKTETLLFRGLKALMACMGLVVPRGVEA